MINKITKQLAGIEDLAIGTGKVQQKRAGKTVTINRLKIPFQCETVEDMQLLDPAKFPFALVEDVPYIYSEEDLTGIPSSLGPGAWVVDKTPASTIVADSGDTLQELIDGLVITYESVQDMIDGVPIKCKGGDKVLTLKSSEDVISKWCVVTLEPSTGYYVSLEGGLFASLISSDGDIRHYGAERGADVTQACQAAMNHVGALHFPKNTESEPWLLTSLATTRTTSVTTEGDVYIKALPAGNSPLVALNHKNSSWPWTAKVDMDSTSRTAVRVNADRVTAYVDCVGVSANVDAANTTSGLNLSGGKLFKGGYRVTNINNTGHPNESVPRACSVDAEMGDYVVDFAIMQDNDGGGHVAGGSKDGVITFCHAKDVTDQPIYAVSGAVVNICNLITERIEEGCVGSSSASITVNDWKHFGDASWLIGVDNANTLRVDNLTMSSDRVAGGTPRVAGLIRTRAGNSHTGSITVGRLAGSCTANNQLMKLDVGNVGRLNVSSVNYVYNYIPGFSATPTQLCNLIGVQEYSLSDWEVRIVDTEDALTSEIFQVILPSASLLRESSISGKFDFYLLNSERNGNAQGQVRIINATHEKTNAPNLRYQTNVGPYGREVAYSPAGSVSQAPSIGYWKRGTYTLRNAASAPFFATCHAEGSPGGWVTH